MRFPRYLALALSGVGLARFGAPARAQTRHDLTSAEREKLRDAQDPSARIKVYLALAQDRLDRLEQLGALPAARSASSRLLDQYISITDEMKRWIQYQFDRQGDMRDGLRSLVERGPQQVEELRRIEAPSAAHGGEYERSLKDAIADMTDAVDGGARALSDQEKTFGKLKQERKLEAQEIKARRKEEQKRNKEEKKLLKRLRKKDHSAGGGAD